MTELSDIVGQDAAVEQLQRALAAGRMPHAYLSAGPAGVGRRTTAIALARTLLCEKPADDPRVGRDESAGKPLPFRQACGACEDCRMMAAGSHPDFQLVYKELAQFHDDPNVRSRVMQDLGIDVIRSFLIAPAARAPSRGRGRVFVVLEAELMSTAAQNALLKTLEEPPAGVTIILLCQRPEQMLPTTRSRCSIVRFGPLPHGFVTEKLIAAGVADKEAGFWAAFTDGSLGRSQQLLEEAMYKVKQEVISHIASPGEENGGEYLAKLADKLATSAVNAAKKDGGAPLSKMLANRRATGVMLELIASAFRDAMTIAAGAERPIIHTDQRGSVAALAERFAPTRLAEIVEQLSAYERLLWRNVNPKIIWDNVAITCASGVPLGL